MVSHVQLHGPVGGHQLASLTEMLGKHGQVFVDRHGAHTLVQVFFRQLHRVVTTSTDQEVQMFEASQVQSPGDLSRGEYVRQDQSSVQIIGPKSGDGLQDVLKGRTAQLLDRGLVAACAAESWLLRSICVNGVRG